MPGWCYYLGSNCLQLCLQLLGLLLANATLNGLRGALQNRQAQSVHLDPSTCTALSGRTKGRGVSQLFMCTSTSSLASLSPSPATARTSLMTLILEVASNPSRTICQTNQRHTDRMQYT